MKVLLFVLALKSGMVWPPDRTLEFASLEACETRRAQIMRERVEAVTKEPIAALIDLELTAARIANLVAECVVVE